MDCKGIATWGLRLCGVSASGVGVAQDGIDGAWAPNPAPPFGIGALALVGAWVAVSRKPLGAHGAEPREAPVPSRRIEADKALQLDKDGWCHGAVPLCAQPSPEGACGEVARRLARARPFAGSKGGPHALWRVAMGAGNSSTSDDDATPRFWTRLVTSDRNVRALLERHNSIRALHGDGLMAVARSAQGREMVLRRDIEMAALREEHGGFGTEERAAYEKARRRGLKHRQHGLGRMVDHVANVLKEAHGQDPRLVKALLDEKTDVRQIARTLGAGQRHRVDELHRILTEEQVWLRQILAKARWRAGILELRRDAQASMTVAAFFGSDDRYAFSLKSLASLYHDPSYSELYSSHRPYFTVALVLLQIVFFAVQCKQVGSMHNCGPSVLELRQADLVCERTCVGGEWNYQLHVESRRGEGWRLITYGVLHGDVSHLVGNTVMELFLGIPLEMVHGWHVALISVLCVLGGGVTTLWADPWKPVVGSSGALYGLFGVHFANLLLNWQQLDSVWMKWSRLGLLTGLCVAMGYFAYASEEDGASDTSHGAHVGGIVTGFCFAMPLLRDIKMEMIAHRKAEGVGKNESSPWLEKVFILACMLIGVAYLLFGLMWFWANRTPAMPSVAWWDAWDPVEDWCSAAFTGEVAC